MSAHALADEAARLLALAERGGDDPQTLMATVESLGRIRLLTEGVGTEVAGRLDRVYAEPGDRAIVRAFGERSPQALLQTRARLDPVESMLWVRVGAALRPEVSIHGETLPAPHPSIAEALAAGRLHIASAARVLEALDEIQPYSSFTEREQLEEFLVEKAPELSRRQFATLCGSVLANFAPDNVDERERRLRAKAGITVRQGDDGLVHIHIAAHPEAAGFILTALDSITSPRRGFVPTEEVETDADGADRRPLSQRRLDAMQIVCRDFLGRDHGVLAGNTVTMRVSVTLDALRTGLGTAEVDGIDEPISAATARRLAADAEIIPVVLGGPSEPLDLGRAARLASGPQRDAIAIRDGGCMWTGCDAPPGWCEVAHVVAWALGGKTDLDNMVLLCPFHHRCLDTGGWEFTSIEGRRCFIPPAWVDSARTPRLANERHVLAA